MALENVSSYAEFHDSQMTEWEFLTEVVERADCGILLDVNNIYVSSINHEFDPAEYVDSIPAERVAQIHIAGHSRYERYILDTHDHPVIDPVWKLYERALRRTGPTATLLEWDDRIPPFEEVHNEALKAKQYLDAVTGAAGGGRVSRGSSARRAATCRECSMTALLEFQRTMARAVMQPMSSRNYIKRDGAQSPNPRRRRAGEAQLAPQQPGAAGDLQPLLLVARAGRSGRGFPGSARGGGRKTL